MIIHNTGKQNMTVFVFSLSSCSPSLAGGMVGGGSVVGSSVGGWVGAGTGHTHTHRETWQDHQSGRKRQVVPSRAFVWQPNAPLSSTPTPTQRPDTMTHSTSLLLLSLTFPNPLPYPESWVLDVYRENTSSAMCIYNLKLHKQPSCIVLFHLSFCSNSLGYNNQTLSFYFLSIFLSALLSIR